MCAARRNGFSVRGDAYRRFAKEAGDGLRHDAAFLRSRPPLDEHLQVQLLGRQPLQRVLADRPEVLFLHVAEQAAPPGPRLPIFPA